MSRRVIPAGVSLKDFHGWAGNLDRIDVGYNIDPIRAWRTHPISRFAGRVHSRELHCSRRGPPCTDPSSPYQEFKNS